MYRVPKSGEYNFQENVTIKSLDPECTIRSGGVPLKIHGKNLHLIPHPRLLVRFDNGNLYRGVSLLNSARSKMVVFLF